MTSNLARAAAFSGACLAADKASHPLSANHEGSNDKDLRFSHRVQAKRQSNSKKPRQLSYRARGATYGLWRASRPGPA